jgi:hypothetical protein
MKRIIFDHFRRWWWVLALCGLIQVMLGWWIAEHPEIEFEFWVFLVALWVGALLLNFDLQRGAARTIASLPLSARQIGRSWWVATIPIPAIVLAVALFLGAGMFHGFHPNTILPAGRLTLASLFVLPWLGITFTSSYGMTNDAIFGNWRARTSSTFFSLLSTAMLFGDMLTLQNSTKQPVKLAIYFGVGAFLIGAGWFRAERFVLDRASFRLSALTGNKSKGQHQVPTSFGGIRFALQNSFFRVWGIGIVMIAVLNIVLVFEKHSFDWHHLTKPLVNGGFFFPLFFVFYMQSGSLFTNFRYLRTLPLSTGRLVGFIFSEAILPLLTLCLAITALNWFETGSAECLSWVKVEIMAAASVSVFIGVSIWNTTASFVKGLLLAVLILSTIVPVVYEMTWGMNTNNGLPIWFVAVFTVGLFVLSHWATSRIVSRSSAPYRSRPNLMRSRWNWGN